MGNLEKGNIVDLKSGGMGWWSLRGLLTLRINWIVLGWSWLFLDMHVGLVY